MVATDEQTKKELFYFYPKRQLQPDGIHTKPLKIEELKQGYIFYEVISSFKLRYNAVFSWFGRIFLI